MSDAVRAGVGRALGAAGGLWLAFAVVVPWAARVAPDPASGSAALRLGQVPNRAWLASLVLAGLAGLALALRGRAWPAPSGGGPAAPVRGSLRPLELLAVFAATALLYAPPLLARRGPYIEDLYFLSALQRMLCGAVPYRDFEFLYGPLMLLPAHAWAALFGFSMASFYAFLALLEGATLAGLLALVQRFTPTRRAAWLAFALLLPFALNTLLGINWNALRRFLPLAVALPVALGPYAPRRVALAALGLGALLAFSHDYGAAAALGVGALYGAEALAGGWRRAIPAGAALALGSALVWGGLAWALLGDAAPDYAAASLQILTGVSAGTAGLAFHWTLHSLAHFGLLSLAVVAFGLGLRQGDRPLAAGDRWLVFALAYAFVCLKSGLNRADFWHLNAPFLPLIWLALAPLPTRRFAWVPGLRPAALALVATASLTHAFGLLPTGSYWAAGLLGGARDLVQHVPRGPEPPLASAVPALEAERSAPDPDRVALARALAAAPERSWLPYGNLWALPVLVGSCRGGYATDDFLYADAFHPLHDWLAAHPDAWVVIRAGDWEALDAAGPTDPASLDEARYRPSATKRIGAWLSSVHFGGAEAESAVKRDLWRARLGAALRSDYRVRERFGELLLLERDPSSGTP